ncbi:hypothetical protein TCAL_04755 [Tigriopus californicus]|uniref:Uncharacterized protein n=1 Tax=Tigriopus californicus TaxID=6832 RepID=A0A553P1Y6_TIGCA|nr:hypothetical protein TCAL_04755 [Tigriopus californicus]
MSLKGRLWLSWMLFGGLSCLIWTLIVPIQASSIQKHPRHHHPRSHSHHRHHKHNSSIQHHNDKSKRSPSIKHSGCQDDKDCILGTICVNSKCLTVPCQTHEICQKFGGEFERHCQEEVCTRKISPIAQKLTRSPGSRCRYNEECSQNEICIGRLCQRKTCHSDDDCRAFTEFPTKCSYDVCTPHWCDDDEDCPRHYGCYEDREWSRGNFKFCKPYYAECGGGSNCDCGHSVLHCAHGKCFCKAKDSTEQCPMCHSSRDCSNCQKCDDQLCVDDFDKILGGDPECVGKVDGVCQPLCPNCCQDSDCVTECRGTMCCDGECHYEAYEKLPNVCRCETYCDDPDFECTPIPVLNFKKVCLRRQDICECIRMDRNVCCLSNSDCSSVCDECVHNKCRPKPRHECCELDSDCRGPCEKCDRNQCVTLPRTDCCMVDDDCPGQCQECRNHKCHQIKGACLKFSDCQNTEYCDNCQCKQKICEHQAECPPCSKCCIVDGQKICQGRQCCQRDGDCIPTGSLPMVCDDGSCATGCERNFQCHTYSKCHVCDKSSGKCRVDPNKQCCNTNDDCDQLQVCSQGACVLRRCLGISDCPDCYFCCVNDGSCVVEKASGLCYRKPCCNRDSDCEAIGKKCINRVCITEESAAKTLQHLVTKIHALKWTTSEPRTARPFRPGSVYDQPRDLDVVHEVHAESIERTAHPRKHHRQSHSNNPRNKHRDKQNEATLLYEY